MTTLCLSAPLDRIYNEHLWAIVFASLYPFQHGRGESKLMAGISGTLTLSRSFCNPLRNSENVITCVNEMMS